MKLKKMTVVLKSKSKHSSGINLDKILEKEIGTGKYQLQNIAICVLVGFFTGYSSLSYVFIAARVKTRCKIPECEGESEEFSPSWLARAVPMAARAPAGCHRFAPATPSAAADCPVDLFDNSTVIKCAEYVYEHKNSAVYEFDLACDEWRWFIIGSSLVVGTMLSLPISGFIAERWGRRIALSLTMFNYAWINTITYFAGSYTTFVLGGFIGTLLGSSSASCANILALELVEPKHRIIISCIFLTFTAIGGSVLGLVASTEPYWRNLILLIYAPMLVSISFFWIAPESVRWLISKGRYEEAKVILMKAAKLNGKVLSDETLRALSEEHIKVEEAENLESNSIRLVFRDRAILFRCIVALVWWFTTMFVTRGMKIGSVDMRGNKYLNYISASAVHVPAYWLSSYFTKIIGRKSIMIGGFWICAACQLGSFFIPKGKSGLELTVYLLGKFCISSMLLVVNVCNFELFPTFCRTRLMTVSAVTGRLGFFLAPLTPVLASAVWEHLPGILFAGLSLVSGALVLLVPETRTAASKDKKVLGKEQ